MTRTGTVTPRRLTSAAQREYFPAYSPDGQWIAYASWTDSAGGHLWKARTDGSGTPQRLTPEAAWITGPQWTPDGERIVYSSTSRRAALGGGPVSGMGELRWVPANGGPSTTITRSAAAPALVTGGPMGRVYFTQAIPNATPGFNATQSTAVVSVIGLQDLVGRASEVGKTLREPFLFLVVVLAVYLAITWVSTQVLNHVERQVSRGVADAR